MKKDSTLKLKQQLTDIKSMVSNILSYEVLLDYEEEVLNNIYELVNNIMLDKLDDKRYTVEEISDMRIMEYKIILEASTNREIKKLVGLLGKGLKW